MGNACYNGRAIEDFDRKELKVTQPSQKYLQNKQIFLTGASGFLGKVFLSKILEEEPSKIYILVLHKNGENSFERFKKIISDSLCFSHIKAEQKENFETFIEEHIKVVEGDISKENLGLSEKDLSEIIKNIDYVFNIGASISWNEDILEMIRNNINSALYAMKIAQQANAKHFVHVSTQATITPLDMIYKRKFFGEVKFNWEEYISRVQAMSEKEIKEETKFIRKNFGTTYAFAKAGADVLIEEKRGNLSTTIISSPSLACSVLHPSPGWLDNVTGNTGNYFYIGLSKSLAYTVNKSIMNTEMPVDIFSNYIYHINKQFTDKNEFNKFSIFSDADSSVYDSMVHAVNYFKSHPVANIKFIEPLFVNTPEEFNKYLDSLRETGNYDEKMIKKTRYFNDLYLMVNFYEISYLGVTDDKLEIIRKSKKEDLKKFPLANEDCVGKKYVELCCEGIKKFYFKA